MLEEFLDTEMFDVVLTHNRYTLLDRSAQPLIEKANAASVGVMNAAVFSGGILAKGPSAMPRYAYKPLDETIRHYIEELYATAGRFGFDLRAAAIQFSLRMPAIGSTVVGASHPNHLEEVVKLATEPIDEQAWRELENCVLPMQHWLG